MVAAPSYVTTAEGHVRIPGVTVSVNQETSLALGEGKRVEA